MSIKGFIQTRYLLSITLSFAIGILLSYAATEFEADVSFRRLAFVMFPALLALVTSLLVGMDNHEPNTKKIVSVLFAFLLMFLVLYGVFYVLEGFFGIVVWHF